MDISICTVTAHSCWFGRISEIEEDETGTTGIIPGWGSVGNDIVEFLVDGDSVAASKREIVDVACQVALTEEDRSLGSIHSQELKADLADCRY
jgi:hypothetical protein